MYHCRHVEEHAGHVDGWKALYLQRADLQSTCGSKTLCQLLVASASDNHATWHSEWGMSWPQRCLVHSTSR